MDRKQTFESLPVTDLDSAPSVFHIYHTGPYKNYYSIHAISDSNTPLNLYPDAPVDTESPVKPSQSTSCFPGRVTAPNTPKKICKAKAFDKPTCDPRTEISPYFLHLPTIYGKNPPYTLRHGGTKSAPTACLLHCSAAWGTWRLEFGDVLAQPEVVDGRGVVNIRHGTKKGEDGTFKGYDVRSKRYTGESGKAWHKLRGTVEEKSTEPMDKAKPEEVVNLKWTAPLSFRTREYRFTWRNFDFIWKGTSTVHSKKLFHPFLRYNHLKLVVLIPGKNLDGQQQQEELILARYTSVVAKRKSGRLELCQQAIDSFMNENIQSLCESVQVAILPLSAGYEKEKLSSAQEIDPKSAAKTTQRFRDVVVGTALCMIIGEFTKRQVLIQVILALVGAAGD
ncbi:hypothetical protein DL98DRAFT_179669 [Cadophora sp. DSE1049]|nr:hypothetical protein DL98DRAFT_179669 [Cadophora sp. DSE1049]